MNKNLQQFLLFVRRFFLVVGFLCVPTMKEYHSLYAQSVNINTQINGFRHNWDCGNDGANNNEPDIRYKVWFGWNGGNFNQSTNGPGLYCGASNYTYGTDGANCSTWNPGLIPGPTLTGNATTLNVDMQSWEEDESGTIGCSGDDCNANNSGFPCGNNDDTRCGRLRIGDINFLNNAPCTDFTFTGEFTSGSFLSMHNRCSDNNGAGYGLNQLIVNWNFAEAPTIVTQPTDASYGGATRTVCSGLPVTVTVVSNDKTGGTTAWTLARWVKWQSASAAGGPWTDIAGTLNATAYTSQTTFTYTFTPGATGTTYYRAVLSSACATGFASLTTTSSAVEIIVRDATTDPFCTAPGCGIVYVDPVFGNDATGNGTPSNPYLTISRAATSGVTYIRVAQGTGTDGNIVNIPDNCVIEGGYVRSGLSGEFWEKSSNTGNKTVITFSGTEFVDANSAHIAAFKSDAKSGWIVKDIDVVTANTPASTYASSGRGMSNYGFLIINGSSNYTLSRVNITVGNAGIGADGTTPAVGGGSSGGAGGSGSGGCTLGSGDCTIANASNGAAGSGVGSPVNINRGAGFSSSGLGCNASRGSINGNNGTVGATGNTGTTGAVGSTYTMTGSYFVPGGQGGVGGPGGGGQGGGGGSGSIGGAVRGFCITTSCSNFSGTTGGTGGQGGSGGTGGFGGGGSFGIWRNNSSIGSILIEDVNISSIGTVGAGGNGAIGSNGLVGSSASSSGGCNNTCVPGNACAGTGGQGGTGGRGGTGGNGVAGTTAATVTDGATTATLTATIPFPSTITLDNFSDRNNISGKMCNNSEIDIKNSTGSALSLPAGLTIVNDLTSSTSSYGLSSNPIKVTTDNANTFHNIGTSTTTLNKFLYTVTDNRSLPAVAITPSTKVICRGNSITLNKTNSYDVGNIQQYEYIVFANGSNANTPLYSSTASTFTTPVINTTGRYWVRYRERHNCCGWSRPVFDFFDVIDAPYAPTAISVNGPLCYSSPAASFTISVTGTKAYTAHDSWELFDTDPAFGTPTPIDTSTADNPTFTVSPSQTTTYYVRGKNICNTSAALSVTAVVSGDQNANGVLATATSTRTCVVNDNLWHYFRNSTGQIIAAINSHGQDLGNVTMEVRIENNLHHTTYDSPEHGNGGLGRNGDCLGQPELSMRRWYTITPQFQPTAGNPSTIRLFFTPLDYANYSSEINLWRPAFAPAYTLCYGTTANAEDLAVSKDESADIPIASTSLNGGPDNTTQYQLSIPSFSTFRFHTSGGIGDPLPVELISFTGYHESVRNTLIWKTASESNTDRFDIEKSIDGSNWQYIGMQKAAGTTTSPMDYTFYDNNPVMGNNYYRLKIVDNDASYEYSNIINIKVGETEVNGIASVYPNPTDNEVTVVIQTTQPQQTYITVTNLLGQVVMDIPTTLVNGTNTIQLQTSNLPAGTYLISYTDQNSKRYTEKLIKK